MGLRDAGARYAQLRAAVDKFGLPLPAREALRASKSRFADESRVREAVSSARSVKHALEMLELSLARKNYDALLHACVVYDIPAPPKHGGRDWGPRRETASVPVRQQPLADREKVVVAVRTSTTWEVAWRRLSRSNAGPSVRQLRELRRIAHEEDVSLKTRSMSSLHYTQQRAHEWRQRPDELDTVLREATSSKDAAARLGLSNSRSGIQAVRELLDERGFGEIAKAQHSSVAGTRSRLGLEILVANSTANTTSARRVIRRESLLPDVCSLCELGTEWRGKPITLILDHINGDPRDHRIENLRFVCPNCESQLPTTGSRNRKRKNNTNKA